MLTVLVLAAGTATAAAGEVDVEAARVICQGTRCTATVTLRHDDTGWDHYADHWRVLAPDGKELGRRVLWHPHVQEQPFTRSLDRLDLPAGLDTVIIEGHDKVHGYGGKRLTVRVERN